IPTWLTGLLVAARIVQSATAVPRNSHRSPVEAIATASWRVMVESFTSLPYAAVRMRWKRVGLAGLAGVAATGVVVARQRRAQHDYQPDELRERLPRRLDDIPHVDHQPADPVPPAVNREDAAPEPGTFS